MSNRDEIPHQLEIVKKMHAWLGFPKLTEQSLADIADLTGVPLRRVTNFALYGRIL